MKSVRVYPKELENDKKFIYATLNSASGGRLSDVDPRNELQCDAFVLGESTDITTGEVRNLLALKIRGEGIVYTVSNTFITRFLDCVDTLETLDFKFRVPHDKNKAGREYISFELIYEVE